MHSIGYSPSLQGQIRSFKLIGNRGIVSPFISAMTVSDEESKAVAQVFSDQELEKPDQVKDLWF